MPGRARSLGVVLCGMGLGTAACLGAEEATEEAVAGLEPVGPIHLGDLDLVPARQMTAAAEIHDQNHALVAGATVQGTFTRYSWACGPTPPESYPVLGTQDESCVTDASGRCSMRTRLKCDSRGFVIFRVTNAALAGHTYDVSQNHDPEWQGWGGEVQCYGSDPCIDIIVSDRDQKQDVAPVDERAVLESVSRLPISTWSYRADPEVRHLGPMAQDFRAAFGLGETDRLYHSVDAHGVALASVKALYDIIREQDARLRQLEADALDPRAPICEP